METKTCPRCQAEKPLAAFPAKAGRRCGTYCTPCKQDYDREYYAATQAARARNKQKTKLAIKERNRLYVLRYLRDCGGCADCGETDLVVLEFDHLDPALKLDSLSQMIWGGSSLKRIADELAKCDVVCANCHRRRTARQFSWTKASLIAQLN